MIGVLSLKVQHLSWPGLDQDKTSSTVSDSPVAIVLIAV